MVGIQVVCLDVNGIKELREWTKLGDEFQAYTLLTSILD